MPVFRASIIAAAVAFGLIAAMAGLVHWHLARRDTRMDVMYAPARPSPVPLVAAELKPIASAPMSGTGAESSLPVVTKAHAALDGR